MKERKSEFSFTYIFPDRDLFYQMIPLLLIVSLNLGKPQIQKILEDVDDVLMKCQYSLNVYALSNSFFVFESSICIAPLL